MEKEIDSEQIDKERQLVSLKTLAVEWDCSRNTVRRILSEAGVRAYFLSDKRNGTVRYSRAEVDRFLDQCRERREGPWQNEKK